MGSLSKTPGDSNQKIMGSFRFGIALLVLTGVATAKDVFRYVDEETGQSHYMTGDPGSSVEGGWTFTNSDGTFELAYKADEAGFQPEAEHIPIPVEDTNEVTGAKNTFYSLVEEHKAKVEAAKAEAVVDARRKRSPDDVFRYEDEATGQSHYMTGEPGKAVEGGWTFTNPEGSYELVYKADEGGFQPEAAHIPVPVEDTNEVTGAKTAFYSFYDAHKAKVEAGFVPEAAYIPDTNEVTEAKTTFYSLYDEHKTKVEAAIAKDAAEAVVDARRKRDAHGFYKLHPYHTAAKEGEEVKEFKFLPYHGFVPADEMVEGEEALLKNLHPYHKKMASKKFKLDPYHGFVPIMEEEAPAAVSERKKRDVMDMSMEKSQDLTLPPPPHPYNFHPFLGRGGVKPEDSDSKLYKYVPYYGFVPAEGKADEEDPEAEGEDEEKDEILYKYDALYGFVKADDEIKPLEEQEYKYTPYVGFVPATGDEDED